MPKKKNKTSQGLNLLKLRLTRRPIKRRHRNSLKFHLETWLMLNKRESKWLKGQPRFKNYTPSRKLLIREAPWKHRMARLSQRLKLGFQSQGNESLPSRNRSNLNSRQQLVAKRSQFRKKISLKPTPNSNSQDSSLSGKHKLLSLKRITGQLNLK